MVAHREKVEAHGQDVERLWKKGWSITRIAGALGVRRAVVSNYLIESGLRMQSPDASVSRSMERREAVRRWAAEHPGSTLDEIAEGTGCAKRTVSSYLDRAPEAELVMIRRPRDNDYTDDAMTEALWSVWMQLPTAERRVGLSKRCYNELAGPGMPSGALFERRYGSWAKACEQAGAVPRAVRRAYTTAFSNDDILDAMEACFEETGKTSFKNYTAWSSQQGPSRPSGALVVLRMGTWNGARTALMRRRNAA